MNRIIALAMVKPGMVLGEAASANDQVLLATGTTLTVAHLALLNSRGVRSLSVAVADDQRVPVDTKLVMAMDRSLRPRFVCTDLKHPAIKEIYRIALLRCIQIAATKPAGASHAG
jgi:hypothetical protein